MHLGNIMNTRMWRIHFLSVLVLLPNKNKNRCIGNEKDGQVPSNESMSKSKGLLRELNPGPLAPDARILPLDQAANKT